MSLKKIIADTLTMAISGSLITTSIVSLLTPNEHMNILPFLILIFAISSIIYHIVCMNRREKESYEYQVQEAQMRLDRE
tara:strand:- start:474 stop:710 length:237 start_codon:yes stop_codon:yes gene_type:complete